NIALFPRLLGGMGGASLLVSGGLPRSTIFPSRDVLLPFTVSLEYKVRTPRLAPAGLAGIWNAELPGKLLPATTAGAAKVILAWAGAGAWGRSRYKVGIRAS